MPGRRPQAKTPAVARALTKARGRPGAIRGQRPGDRVARHVKAVMPVHMAGHPCEMDAITAIADEHGLAIVEDAAHACSASFKGRRSAAQWRPVFLGPPASRSMPQRRSPPARGHGHHRQRGMGGPHSRDESARDQQGRLEAVYGGGQLVLRDRGSRLQVQHAGHRRRLGLAQLRKVDTMRQRREEIARRYNEAFAEYPEIETPTVREHVGHAWHLYMLRLNGDSLAIGRDEFIENLKTRNISSSVHFIPLHVHPYYQAAYGYRPEDFPVAFREYQREISLPIYSKMTDLDVQSVIDAVTDIIREFRHEVLLCACWTLASRSSG